jgi:hypothetical protein
MSPELFERERFSIKPEPGRTEPRLWIRRLAIWNEGEKPFRDILFKKGLNIVWSPDPRSRDVAMGHGGGKTTLCRLIRYCLGEDSFASDLQRRRIADKLPKGWVGAEVLVGGCLWSVVRPLGFRKKDIVAENVTLEEAANAPATGIDAFREAITSAVLGDAAQFMPPAVGQSHAWEAALAWATRDQECRFEDHMVWRDPDTDSHSPVRKLGAAELLVIVRALIGAITREEIATQDLLEKKTKELSSRAQNADRLKWQIAETRDTILQKLNIVPAGAPGSPIELQMFSSSAAEDLARKSRISLTLVTQDVSSVRKQRDEEVAAFHQVSSDLSNAESVLPVSQRLLAQLLGEEQDLGNQLVTAKNPICPVCETPIDEVLAEGCRISKVKCDLEKVRARIASVKAEIVSEQERIAKLRSDIDLLTRQRDEHHAHLKQLDVALKDLDRAENDRSQSVGDARNTVYDVERYGAMVSRLENFEGTSESLARELESLKQQTVEHRSAAADIIRHLSLLFADVLRELIPGEIGGDVKLDGKGLSLNVRFRDSDRSTAAIDSLKVVAFDLAVLAMSIEGQTCTPSFLLHDSPREADLGLSIYHQLFEFADALEHCGPAPLFQYIVTTTTEPPKSFLNDEWLRLTIRGAPASERLLLMDL